MIIAIKPIGKRWNAFSYLDDVTLTICVCFRYTTHLPKMFKLQIAFCCILVASVEGGLIASSAPVLRELDAYPQYNYGYSVQDPITGDVKGQEESRNGDVVRGRYSLIEPDGTLRIVNYFADSTGFHARVEKQPGFSAPVQVVQGSHVVPAQVPFRPIPPPAHPQPVEVTVPVQQPVQVEEVLQPQPQPVDAPQIPVQPQPQPPQFQPQPQPPQFQPQPPQAPQQPPTAQPQPRPPQFPAQPEPQPPQVPQQPPAPQPQPPFQPQPQPEETFDDAEIIEARSGRGSSASGRGSSVSFRSSRMGQHDFNFSF
ncbi:protein TsetseEP [Folsomia candida]|nr:protein TsetseEP [Folsomia candida]